MFVFIVYFLVLMSVVNASPFNWIYSSLSPESNPEKLDQIMVIPTPSGPSSKERIESLQTIGRYNKTSFRSKKHHHHQLDPSVFDQQIDAFITSMFSNAHQDISGLSEDNGKHVDCIRHALHELLPKCLIGSFEGDDPGSGPSVSFTLSDDERRKYSIALSVCQFKASYMEYPAVCDGVSTASASSISSNKDEIKQCLLNLQVNSQWWTTFNGYYQTVGSLCLEQSNTFHRDRILGVYEDMTSVQEVLLRNVQTAYSELSKQQAVVNNTLDILDLLRRDLEVHVRDVKYEINDMMRKMSSSAADHFEADLQALLDNLTGALLDKVSQVERQVEQSSLMVSQNLVNLVDTLTSAVGAGIVEMQQEVGLVLGQVEDRITTMRASTDELTDSHNDLKDLQYLLGLEISSSINLIETSLSPTLENLTQQVQNVTQQLSDLSIPFIITRILGLTSIGSYIKPAVLLFLILWVLLPSSPASRVGVVGLGQQQHSSGTGNNFLFGLTFTNSVYIIIVVVVVVVVVGLGIIAVVTIIITTKTKPTLLEIASTAAGQFQYFQILEFLNLLLYLPASQQGEGRPWPATIMLGLSGAMIIIVAIVACWIALRMQKRGISIIMGFKRRWFPQTISQVDLVQYNQTLCKVYRTMNS